ncbi:TPA: hypothetical protein MBF00_000594 [Klebsiella aerogenes]|nr:hypothetical protein [Klebsiella aerogenes]
MSDIFVGNHVRVAVNKNTESLNPSFYDPGYIETKNLASFPQIQMTKAVERMEDYRSDYTTVLSGDINITDTDISVLETVESEFSSILEDALVNKTKVRFRVLYATNSNFESESVPGLYHIFDTFVTKKSISGSANTAVTTVFRLSPDGKLHTGFVEAGKPLITGDFGVGAGTEDIPGVYDIGLLTGNRWITVDASETQNPFAQDTSMMALQHPEGQGWDLIGTSAGNPAVRIRNKQMINGEIKSSKWIKLYSELERPTAQDVGALPITGGTVTGAVTINTDLTVKRKATIETAQINSLNTKTITSDSVKVKGAEVYSPSNKPKPIDINAVERGELISAGKF